MQKDAEISSLKSELAKAKSTIEALEDEKKSLENSVKAGQVQKEIFYDETDKIQNVQQQEIVKLKSMLLFREQVSLLIRFCVIELSQRVLPGILGSPQPLEERRTANPKSQSRNPANFPHRKQLRERQSKFVAQIHNSYQAHRSVYNCFGAFLLLPLFLIIFRVFFLCFKFFFIHVCVFLLCFTFDLIVLWKFDVLSAGEYENFHDLDGGMDELHIALSRLCTLSRTRLLTKTICLLG